MKLEQMFIGAVLFGVVFVIGLNVYGETMSVYGVNSNGYGAWSAMHTNLKQYYDAEQQMKDNIRNIHVTEGSSVDDMVAGAYTGIRASPYDMIGIATNATSQLALDTHYVDPLFLWAFGTVVTILVTFAILAIIFKFR